MEHSAVRRLEVDGPCLDSVRVERLRQALREAIKMGARAVVVDMKNIERLDALGLSGLVLLPEDAAAHAHLAVASLQPMVQDTALLVHLHEILDIYADPHGATLDLHERIGTP
jgi:anti-anti-sigma factor